ncbi:unnamed protein product [Gadus morhua 'NCC']
MVMLDEPVGPVNRAAHRVPSDGTDPQLLSRYPRHVAEDHRSLSRHYPGLLRPGPRSHLPGPRFPTAPPPVSNGPATSLHRTGPRSPPDRPTGPQSPTCSPCGPPPFSDMVSGPLTLPRVPLSTQAGMFFFQPGMMHLRAAKESTVAR